MPTAAEIITEMEKLSSEEIRVIIRHFEPEEKFSDDIVRQLLQAKKDDEQGINMSGPFRGKEAIDYLTELEKQAQV
ncbi:MAG: hypothetical protein C4527_29570 [Candidatus Omnitrophota bacterium]|nr:MAG: hypothetical protein C4527_29570 [Candidatus Omnitrophota bacterium]